MKISTAAKRYFIRLINFNLISLHFRSPVDTNYGRTRRRHLFLWSRTSFSLHFVGARIMFAESVDASVVC